MLEHSVYSVISPEGCASILWKDAEKMREAAEALRLTAQDLLRLEVIDRIVEEPVGGAHRDRAAAIEAVGNALREMLDEFESLDAGAIRADRRRKYLEIGARGLAA
jgi:acetyl-CoA carboxylase carboxyl transferase subunit alpha